MHDCGKVLTEILKSTSSASYEFGVPKRKPCACNRMKGLFPKYYRMEDRIWQINLENMHIRRGSIRVEESTDLLFHFETLMVTIVIGTSWLPESDTECNLPG